MVRRSHIPSPPAVAVAHCLGIALARLAGPISTAPVAWLGLAVALACLARGRAVLLACAVLCGGACMANWTARDAALPMVANGVADDRNHEWIEGRVVGFVEDDAARRRFDVELAAPDRGTVRLSVPREVDVLPGDRLRARTRLRTPRGYRNPGAVDRWRAARDRGYQLVGFAPASDVERLGRDGGLRAWAMRFHRRVASHLRGSGDAAASRSRGIVAAMVIGDRSGLNPQVRDDFAAAGLAHILAVSGLHLAVTALLAFALVRRLWALIPAAARRLDPARAAVAVAVPVAALYTLATGARVSTARALVVVVVVLVGVALRRRVALADSLAVAALALSAAHPPLIYDTGFQLSFAATAALAVLLRGSRRRDGSVLRRVGRALRDSAAVSLAVAPLTAVHFGAVAVGGIAANLVALPLAELVILPAGLASVFFAEIASPLADAALAVATVAAGGLDAIARATAQVAPPLRVQPGVVGVVGLTAAGVAATMWFMVRVRRLAWTRAAGIAGVAAAATIAVAVPASKPAGLRVTFIDVGQGDAALLEMPDGQAWLVDGGGLPFVADAANAVERARRAELPGARAIVPVLRARGVRRIDVAVVSHPHPDHYVGLRAVAREVPIGELWVAEPHREQPWPAEFVAVVDRLRAAGTRIARPRAGPQSASGATVDVLAPVYGGAVADDPVLSANDNSLALAVTYAGRRVLFAGDLESEGEQLLTERAAGRLRADVVKVPHHGSRTSSGPSFVSAVLPEVAVISCGVGNRFGFPAADVVERWRRAGAQVVRTDEAGAVTVHVTPSGDLHVETFDTTVPRPAVAGDASSRASP